MLSFDYIRLETERKRILIMKRTNMTCLVLILAFALAVCAGCAGDKPAAKVGTEEIKVSHLENLYSGNAGNAGYYGYSTETAEDIETYQDYLLDSLISSEVKAYKAREAGLTLTDEEQTQAQKDADAEFDEFYQQFADAAKNSGATDVNAYANKLLTDTLSSNRTSIRKLKEDFLSSAIDSLLVSKHKEQLLADVTPTAEEIKTMYDEELAKQEALFGATPSSYFTYETYSLYGYTAMPLYIPEGFFYVRNILVSDETLAGEIKAKLDAGEDFETLLAEYNEDSGMESETYADGYIVGEGSSLDEAFLKAALLLKKEGDVSEPTKSSYGYHIIKRMGDVPAGPIDYEKLQESFAAYATSLFKAEYYAELVNGWMAEDIVTRYPENYRHIGKSALEG